MQHLWHQLVELHFHPFSRVIDVQPETRVALHVSQTWEKQKSLKAFFFKIALLRTNAEKAQWCSLSQSICLIISLIPVHLWPKRVTWSRLSPYFISSIVLCVFFKSVIFKRKFGISLIDDVVSFMFGIIEGINVCLFNLFFFKKVNGFRNCWRDSKMTQLTDFYLFIVKNLASLKFS